MRFTFVILTAFAFNLFLSAPNQVEAHSGGTNALGCHAGSKPYHCHTPKNSFQKPPTDNSILPPKNQVPPLLLDSSEIVKPNYFRANGIGIVCPAMRTEDTKVILLSGDRSEAGVAQFNGEDVRYIKTNTAVTATVVRFGTIGETWTLDRKTGQLTISSLFPAINRTLSCTVLSIEEAHKRAINMLDILKKERKF